MREEVTKCNNCKEIILASNRINVIGSINPIIHYSGDFCDKCANEFHRIVLKFNFKPAK